MSFDAVDTVDKIIHGSMSLFPYWSSFMLALLFLGILLFLHIVIKLALSYINMLEDIIHGLKLKMDSQGVINLTA